MPHQTLFWCQSKLLTLATKGQTMHTIFKVASWQPNMKRNRTLLAGLRLINGNRKMMTFVGVRKSDTLANRVSFSIWLKIWDLTPGKTWNITSVPNYKRKVLKCWAFSLEIQIWSLMARISTESLLRSDHKLKLKLNRKHSWTMIVWGRWGRDNSCRLTFVLETILCPQTLYRASYRAKKYIN